MALAFHIHRLHGLLLQVEADELPKFLGVKMMNYYLNSWKSKQHSFSPLFLPPDFIFLTNHNLLLVTTCLHCLRFLRIGARHFHLSLLSVSVHLQKISKKSTGKLKLPPAPPLIASSLPLSEKPLFFAPESTSPTGGYLKFFTFT